MLLYKVPRNTWIKVEGIEELVLFHHVDGAYSYCHLYTKDTPPKKIPVHLSANTDVEVIKCE